MTDRSTAPTTEPETLRRTLPAAVFGGAREFHFERHHFDLIAGLLYQLAGIALAPHKAEMVYARLARRLRELRLPDFDAYCALLQSDDVTDEIGFLVNALTTNLTSFYRESHHFDFLASTVLPELRALNAHQPKPRLRLWSAGCSSGPEPYSMAMVLVSTMGAELRRWDARILATDIDTHMVETARRGIYPLSGATGIPPQVRQRFTTDTRLEGEPVVAMGEELKRLVTVKPLNLLEHWPMSGPFDAIFCRNVLIYFDRRGRMQVIENFARMLRPGGYLFLGHSESLYGVSNLFRQAGPTIYRRD
ncbi:chemotaxis protein methyltransferase CheR [Azospirillum lipoferum]|uniref:Chemotaxis protein methyltransferase n=1 Tax=Azospirillum lipoferum TaxID=193 RepID=A0A5A9GUM3_AZOLI|nr:MULTISPECIES: protein-glutamate O-methyltransferase [Azospirillum]KAA0598107.1 methyltransferase domain-containing protein [Azospirillum lipoferum]MCP1613771.1 chemotaxis protein methyltransferase CheR [Azospirillum lipoferum]MDW5534777.1 protein-glutamate O-methyltransferase [Azospirillum sp. NL1]